MTPPAKQALAFPPDAVARTTQPAAQLTTSDGLELAAYRWAPEPSAGPTRASIALVHGLAEHAGRYAPLGACLNAAGIELTAIDLRGHGQSPGERAWVDTIDDYLNDVQALVTHAARPATPLFLMGHSMGGALAALFALERLPHLARVREHVRGLVLSSAALAPGRDVPRWKLTAGRFMGRIWPRFPAMRIEPSLLSRDAAVVAANRADALVHHGSIPARTGASILEAMTRIERQRAALSLPALVLHGTEDELTEPAGSREFAAHVGSADCTLRIYEGSYHETMNDLDRERVIGDLVAWVLTRA